MRSGGVVSAIWLALIGQWWALGVGLASLFVSHFLVSILLMPSLLSAAPAAALSERGKHGAASVLAGVSSLFTAALIAVRGIAVLYLLASRATAGSVILLLIWSYGVARGPWSFLASKDQQAGGTECSAMATYFLQVGYVMAIVLVLVSRSLAPGAFALAAAMGINWVLQMTSMRAQLRDLRLSGLQGIRAGASGLGLGPRNHSRRVQPGPPSTSDEGDLVCGQRRYNRYRGGVGLCPQAQG